MALKVVPEREDLKVMSIRHDAESATIEMTDEGLALMTDAVASWLAGADDFGVSPQRSCLKTKLRQMELADIHSGRGRASGSAVHPPSALDVKDACT